MVSGPSIARDIAANVLTHPSFTSSAIVLRQTEGHRATNGQWIAGAELATPSTVVNVPITGQQRLTVPEGLRDEDVRKFWLLGDEQRALRAGLTDGDRLVLGILGMAQNVFTGASVAQAERARDQYGVANPAWLAMYQSTTANVIQLRGFGGHSIYQRYDATNGHWLNADTYRAFGAQPWGGFVEIQAVRIDPGNL